MIIRSDNKTANNSEQTRPKQIAKTAKEIVQIIYEFLPGTMLYDVYNKRTLISQKPITDKSIEKISRIITSIPHNIMWIASYIEWKEIIVQAKKSLREVLEKWEIPEDKWMIIIRSCRLLTKVSYRWWAKILGDWKKSEQI
jgi:hypothetical protein